MDKKLDIILQNQIAIFNLIGELYRCEKGQTPIVAVNTKNGVLSLTPSANSVTSRAEASRNSVECQKETSITS